MIILITILYFLGGIIGLLLILALLIKKDFVLQKTITINSPKATVFNFLKQIKNQEQYSVWVMKDPNVKMVYTGSDGTVGFIAGWTSDNKNVGIGEQEIIKMTESESMQVEIRFKKPFEATNYATTTVAALSDSQTKVSNVFTGRQKFPLNIMNVMIDKLVGKDMQQNLENMKVILEKN